MRYLPSVLLLIGSAAACGDAAKAPLGATPPPAAWTEYERAHDEWLRALTAKLATDADVDIAWAGMALGARLGKSDDHNVDRSPPLPPLPTSGVGQLLYFEYCETAKDCPDVLARWIAAEPDNLAVLALAHENHDERLPPVDFTRATRYDDYSLALQTLGAKIAARYDLTPPPKPHDYRYRGFFVFAGIDRFETQIALTSMGFTDPLGSLVSDAELDPHLRLKFADLLIGAKGSPFAAGYGAELGVAAAVDPAQRERYCRVAERVEAISAELDQLLNNEAFMRAVMIALRTRNNVDAYAAVAAAIPLPENARAAPPDEAAIAACVERTGTDADRSPRID